MSSSSSAGQQLVPSAAAEGTGILVDPRSIGDLRAELQLVESAGMRWDLLAGTDAGRGTELVLTAGSHRDINQAMRIVRTATSVVVVVPDLDGRLSALFIEAGAMAVWNRLVDPRGLPALLRRLASREPREPALRADELQLLSLLSTDATMRDIAKQLFISERSFYRRLKSLYVKLGVYSRSEAVYRYLDGHHPHVPTLASIRPRIR
ncbi:hypothetical protein GCM10012275_35160 [Longimycelium tulufanense]|uniref:HTH luxR-type domain-containing protein n=1 Tax=Longimycelium tulufanense TaxID=907463 RepID=A0A8J3CFS9_9PSEU|nr:helix-turn-helix transcriptional regulator [Longimycelium tulufanense]GGM61069.1 hypothetical protein GCM10012275_35160 [Longimycelium tulufanense]